MKKYLYGLTVLLASNFGYSKCLKSPLMNPSPYFGQRETCHPNGVIKTFEEYFLDYQTSAVVYDFNESGELIKYRTYDSEHRLVQSADYLPLGQNLYSFIQEKIIENTKGHTESKVKIEFNGKFQESTLETTFYKSRKKFLTEYYNYTTNTQLIDRILIYDEKENIELDYHIQTIQGPKQTLLITAFTVYNSVGEKIGEYKRNSDLPALKNNDKSPVILIDSGLDTNHPELKNSIYHGSGYGIFEGFRFGWHFDSFTGQNRPQVSDDIFYQLGKYPYVPFSHGTHVGGILIKDVSKYGLVTFGGDYSDPDYLDRISQWVQISQTRFVNMSFGFGDLQNPFGAGSESRNHLIQLMHNNQNTLFIVAAGNESSNLDLPEKDDVPPKAPVENKIVVAALDTDQINPTKIDTYKLASFSNYDLETVDIAAPGVEVESTHIGGTRIRVSGTSMAAPYVLNTLLKMSELNPQLSNNQLRDLLFCTAYKNTNIQIKAHKIINPEAALQAAKNSLYNPIQQVCSHK